MFRRKRVVIAVSVVGCYLVLTTAVLGFTTTIRGPLAAVRSTLASTAAPDVAVQGNQLVDLNTGEVFIPRGMNVPGFEYACAQGWGSSEFDGWSSVRDLRGHLRSWHVNTVRLPLNLDCWLGSRSAPVNGGLLTRNRFAYRTAVRTFVDTMRAGGIVVILDLHARKGMGIDDFGTHMGIGEAGLDFWRSLADEYQDVTGVMFDVMNEPHSRYDEQQGFWVYEMTWECWQSGGCYAPVETDQNPMLGGETYEVRGMADAVRVIREAGAYQPVLLSGLDWANDLTGWLSHRPDDSQLIAAAHLYELKRCSTTACYDVELAPIAATVPLLISEVGESDGDTAFLTSVMDWADAHQVGFLAWAWLDDPGNEWSLVTPDGQPFSPAGEAVRTRLTSYS